MVNGLVSEIASVTGKVLHSNSKATNITLQVWMFGTTAPSGRISQLPRVMLLKGSKAYFLKFWLIMMMVNTVRKQ